MTRLTYIFPFLAGCSKTALPILARYVPFDTHLYSLFWLATLISAGYFGVCCAYLLIQILASPLSYRQRFKKHCLSLYRDILAEPCICFSFFNGFFGACEIVGLLYVAFKIPHISLAYVFIGLSQGQLTTSLVSDISGRCCAPRILPWELTLLGATFVYLGTMILQSFYLELSADSNWMLFGYFISIFLGILSFLSYVFTSKLSYSVSSYWGGTATAALGQCICLVTLCVITDSNNSTRSSFQPVADLFKNSESTTVFVLSILSLLISSASVQYFGDSGGFFSVLGPIAAGQIIMILSLELKQLPNMRAEDKQFIYPFFSFFSIISVIFIFLGSALMWVGRWNNQDASETHSLTHQLRSLVTDIQSDAILPRNGPGIIDSEREFPKTVTTSG